MKNVERKVDLNSQLENLEYHLIIDKCKNEVSISFRNATDKILTEVAFMAKGFDYFGEQIAVGDKDFFVIELHNLKLFPGEMVLNYIVPVSKAIRKIELSQYYVADLEANKDFYLGTDYKIYYFDKLFLDEYKDKKELDMLLKFNSHATCYPTEMDNGWICCCGYFNTRSHGTCKFCRCLKQDVFLETSKSSILKKLEVEETEFYQRMKKRRIAKEKLERKNCIIFWLQFISAICLLVGLLAAWILLHAS